MIIMHKKKITIKLHFNRSDNRYDGWNVWMWTLNNGGTEYKFSKEQDDMVTTMMVDGHAANSVSFIVRKGQWEAQEFGERKIDVSTVLSGTVHCYVESGKEDFKVVLGEDVELGNKLLSVELDYDTNCILVKASMPIDDGNSLRLVLTNGKEADIKVREVTGESLDYSISLSKPLDLITLYRYVLRFQGINYQIRTTTVYNSLRFSREFTYSGKDLGAVWSPKFTVFKLWAPTAEELQLALYRSGTAGTADLIKKIDMIRGDYGVWSATVSGDCHGLYYTYLVKVNGCVVEAVDPYARTTGLNGQRGMVIDLSSTNPSGWKSDENPNKIKSYTDAILYELHVRDFSIGEDSGISKPHRGKFLGLTEKGTRTPGGAVTGLDYLKSLGITHLHLLPIYDFGSVDESRLYQPQFNWGYDPVNYNTPEGSYSTDPYDGSVRVKEMKQMVKALHDNGISVVMDVVYNHVYEAGEFCFNKIVPGYFSRSCADGSYSNGSGCGNDTASERPMVRKYIVDSVVYWNEQYHIDGFRFDLVGLLDAETINALVEAVHKKSPDVIFYGEGWTMNTAVEPGIKMATQLNADVTPDFAYFSDTIRDLLAGRNGETRGFVSGYCGQEDPMAHCFTATTSWCPQPTQTVNYASCHDNYTLMDKLALSRPDASLADLIKMNKLAAATYMMAQGIPFIHAGEEFLREKLTEDNVRVENSYNAPDFVNQIRWTLLEEQDNLAVFEYYRGLIAFRKAHPALRMARAEKVAANVTYKWITNEVILFEINGKPAVAGETAEQIVVILNATVDAKTIDLDGAGLNGVWNVCIDDQSAGIDVLRTVKENIVEIAPISAMVLVKE